ncbi:MAG TPA: hypothetical protein VH022_14205, partial [Candidatus Acidoferrum sp.]|nr:hypothetical protein [Candidatus Acidoferrum sp.]
SSGSLFILNIGEAAKVEGGERLVFMRDTWSACPAERWVPAMLEGVWQRATAQDGTTSRPEDSLVIDSNS